VSGTKPVRYRLAVLVALNPHAYFSTISQLPDPGLSATAFDVQGFIEQVRVNQAPANTKTVEAPDQFFNDHLAITRQMMNNGTLKRSPAHVAAGREVIHPRHIGISVFNFNIRQIIELAAASSIHLHLQTETMRPHHVVAQELQEPFCIFIVTRQLTRPRPHNA